MAWPNEKAMKNDWQIQVPWVMGLIGTRSTTKQIPGIIDIKIKNKERILSGIQAVTALEELRANPLSSDAKTRFEAHKADLGFGLLLKKYVNDVSTATPAQIQTAVDSTIPRVAPMFWSFRIMVGLGVLMFILFALSFWNTIRPGFESRRRWLLKFGLYMLPAPWIAIELGWVVAEYGRQPWTIYGVLPTHLSVSTISVESVYGSLFGFVAFYTVLLVVEMYLMIKFTKQGPGSLGTGRYVNEAPHDTHTH